MNDPHGTKAGSAPLVSVILPTYNRAHLLRDSIKTVLEQTIADFELLVVDDGSTDSTAELMVEFTDSRIRYLPQEQNRGLSAARNVGLDHARGSYLAFQDSDDDWYPRLLEMGLQGFEENPAVSVVFGDMIRQLGDGSRWYFHSPEPVAGRLINPETKYWQTYMLAMQPCVIRRDRLGDCRFDEDTPLFEDLDFHLRFSFDNEYVHVPEPFLTYHDTRGLTADRSRELAGRKYILKKYAKQLRREAPGFLIKERLNILRKSSLMPIVNQHLVPM